MPHEEIDQHKWDLCIEHAPNGLVYGFSWFLNTVSPGWTALIYGDYDAVMPLPCKKKFFINYVVQPFFTQQLGVFSKTTIDEAVLDLFLKEIPSKYKFVEIYLNSSNKVSSDDFKIVKRKNYLLSLNRPYEKINKGYNSQAKRNLKKAKKAEVELGKLSSQEVVDFYIRHKAHSTLGLSQKDYKVLLKLMEVSDDNHKLFCRGVFDKSGVLVSTGAFLEHQNRIIFLIGNASSLGRELGAMTYMMDCIVQQFIGQEVVLDFEGSEIDGIARFYRGFGAEKIPYYKFKRNTLPWFIRLLKH